MGTRADFYVGTGPSAEWLGSVAFDGYEWCENDLSAIRQATTEVDFRAAVAVELANRSDATLPEMGWPWPWPTSTTTDYTYYWQEGTVGWTTSGGHWPNMSTRKNVTYGRRSGLILLTLPTD